MTRSAISKSARPAFLSLRKQRELRASESTGLAPQVLPASTLLDGFLTEHSQHVDSPSPPKKEWVLTEEALNCFLSRLNPDRDKAGEKYETVRLKLGRYFLWRGTCDPDVDTDETINRVARRMWEGENIYNLDAYIRGVAKIVAHESLKMKRRRAELDNASGLAVAPVRYEDEAEAAGLQRCFDRCLGYLNNEDRVIVVEYYKFEKGKKIENRRNLAARFHMSLNALRIRAYRKRAGLEACVKECLAPPCA